VTVWNWFYPVFIALIKNMAEEVKPFNPSSYFTLLLTYNLLLPVTFSVMCLCVFMIGSTLAIVNMALPDLEVTVWCMHILCLESNRINFFDKFQQYLRLILTFSFYHLEGVGGKMWVFLVEQCRSTHR